MIAPTSWEYEFAQEIERAKHARANGNEGMARVCARRAAGIIIGEYLHRRGYLKLDTSVTRRLSLFIELPGVNENYKGIVNHFLWKVNQEHRLPMNVDLINDVIWLHDHLLLGRQD